MNAKELIEKLSEYPENTRITVAGYEGGYKDITEAQEIELRLNVHTQWYYGPHEQVFDHENDENSEICLLLS